MKVYQIKFLSDDFKGLLQKTYTKGLLPIYDTKKAEGWTKIKAKYCNKKGITPDLYSFESLYLVLPSEVIGNIEDVLGTGIEMLPIYWEDNGSGLIVNVIDTTDCFDIEGSDIIGDEDFILEIERYSFKKNKVPVNSLFRIPEEPGCLYYAESDDINKSFVNYVNKNSLKGVEFIPLWEC